jgi:hypothetical protein
MLIKATSSTSSSSGPTPDAEGEREDERPERPERLSSSPMPDERPERPERLLGPSSSSKFFVISTRTDSTRTAPTNPNMKTAEKATAFLVIVMMLDNTTIGKMGECNKRQS